MGDERGWDALTVIIIIVLVFVLAKLIFRPKTVIEEIVRDEQGRIVQIVRSES